MPMYLCSYPDRVTLLLERANEGDAKRDATAAADGEEPSRIRRFVPNVFVAEIAFPDLEEGDDDATVDDLEVIPLPHIAELLFDLEPADVDVAASEVTEPSRLLGITTEVCGEEAEDDHGKLVTCAKSPHTDGEHESSGGLVWT